MSDYCEIAEFFSFTEPVARKSHACCECLAPILPGEKHFHGVGTWAGEFHSYRQHLACMEACMLIRDEFNGGNCIGFGSLKEELAEMRADCWYPERERYKEAWKRLRSLMAQIKWRERPYRQKRR